jgi:hypothetical protein
MTLRDHPALRGSESEPDQVATVSDLLTVGLCCFQPRYASGN